MTQSTSTHKANKLLAAKSPYLLQHAYNPVNWYEWLPETLALAKKEDKPILLSVGYSACHWCHVMAHQSFENEEVAQLMNEYFICIKLDREERPDIDGIYMDAVQAMGISGGWPLNVFLMPDLRPFYGGTYFPTERWKNLLLQISNAFTEHRSEIEESAAEFTKHISRSELEKYKLTTSIESELTKDKAKSIFNKLREQFDTEHGGLKRVPKFPLPSVWAFTQHYAWLFQDDQAKEHLLFTLSRMANSGLYDWVGGGFSRYSVDGEWFAPHFEKMLYDNAQLLSVYANAYKWTKEPYLEKVIRQSIKFLKSNLLCKDGGYYAALDADSEGMEGKHYVFTWQEITQLIDAEDLAWFADFFQLTEEGNWEHGFNILYPVQDLSAIAIAFNLPETTLQTRLEQYRIELLNYRNTRVMPGLDDKILVSWNALLLTGLCDSYAALGSVELLTLCDDLAEFIKLQFIKADGTLYHASKDGDAYIEGNLEDYSTVIASFEKYYCVSGNESYLILAKQLLEITLASFYDESDGFFHYALQSSDLITRKKELFDNVIPASNSMMTRNLRILAIHFEQPEWMEIAKKMLQKIEKLLQADVSFLTNWGQLYLEMLTPTIELAIASNQVVNDLGAVNGYYLPSVIIGAGNEQSNLSLLQNRVPEGETTLYFVCKDAACMLPEKDLNKVITTVESLILQGN